MLFGASSVGKTALLRQVLSRDAYHVLHFDLRIAGFADISSLHVSFSSRMEQYFDSLSRSMEGYEEFEKEAWTFKVSVVILNMHDVLHFVQHDRLSIERRLEAGKSEIKTSDVARLMEMFQVCKMTQFTE